MEEKQSMKEARLHVPVRDQRFRNFTVTGLSSVQDIIPSF
jgi:hypothetical protein